MQVPLHETVCGSQRATHAPLVQLRPAAQLCALVACPFDRSPPQPPQFCPSVLMFTQPPLHEERPLPHARPHTEAMHAAVPEPKVGAGQTLPHAPQLFASLVWSTQVLPHFV